MAADHNSLPGSQLGIDFFFQAFAAFVRISNFGVEKADYLDFVFLNARSF